MTQPTTTTTTKKQEPLPESIPPSAPPPSKSPPPEPSDQSKPPDPTPPPPKDSQLQPEPVLEPHEPEETPAGEIIDQDTFGQILELDEDSTHDFSKGMVWAYFAQAEQTFKDMDEALSKEALEDLSGLGHFLKGSSAALGLSNVQVSCEKIQHYGKMRDEDADEDLTKAESLSRIKSLRKQVEKDYGIAERWLKDWYDANATEEPEDDA